MNTTQEMLDFTRSYLDDGSQALVDGDSDILWDDALLLTFMTEAQRQLARAAWCIKEEGVSPAGRLVLATGKAVYDLHPSVLRVELATPSDMENPLFRTSDAVLRGAARDPDLPYDLNDTGTTASGRPLAIATDAGTRQVRIFRTPSAAENGLVVNLKIARLPLVALSVDALEARPETPEDYDFAICIYAAGRALTQPNVDGQQRTIGRDLLVEFNDALRDARRDRQRAEMEPARWGFASSTALADR